MKHTSPNMWLHTNVYLEVAVLWGEGIFKWNLQKYKNESKQDF